MSLLLDILIPRFITEDVAVLEIDGEYSPICNVDDLKAYDVYDKIIMVRTFNFFGFGLFPKMIESEGNNG